MKRILVAEDEQNILQMLVMNLNRAGYEVVEAYNGTAALEKYDKHKGNFDIALLDIKMPGIDGIELCKMLREISDTLGIIMLSAKGTESDKIVGLNTGADDYITKPFSVTELLARIDSVYRRVKLSKGSATSSGGTEKLIHGKFALNLRTRNLEFDDKDVELTQTEFRIVQAFFEAPDNTISRNDLLTKVWGENFYGDDKVVDVNIRRLRMKIEPDPSKPQFIVTVWGLGYRFN